MLYIDLSDDHGVSFIVKGHIVEGIDKGFPIDFLSIAPDQSLDLLGFLIHDLQNSIYDSYQLEALLFLAILFV